MISARGTGAGGDWFAVDDFNGISASQYRRLQIPMTAIRLNVTAGTGSVRMVVNQEF